MNATQSKAWQAAENEGLVYFWARMHVGHEVSFVGHDWQDGGFHCNDQELPVRDINGNTVAKFSSESLDETNSSHVAQVEEWYCA